MIRHRSSCDSFTTKYLSYLFVEGEDLLFQIIKFKTSCNTNHVICYIPSHRTSFCFQSAFASHFRPGPTAGGTVSDEMLDKLASLSTQAFVDGVWSIGWPNAQINSARALDSKMECADRAVILKLCTRDPILHKTSPLAANRPNTRPLNCARKTRLLWWNWWDLGNLREATSSPFD